jgi:flagellar basal-body rod protein FlgB
MSKTGIVELIEAGVKAETLRQKAISNNVANLQTPGYRRLGVKFEQLLSQAIESGDADKIDLDRLRQSFISRKTPR